MATKRVAKTAKILKYSDKTVINMDKAHDKDVIHHMIANASPETLVRWRAAMKVELTKHRLLGIESYEHTETLHNIKKAQAALLKQTIKRATAKLVKKRLLPPIAPEDIKWTS